MAGAAELAVPLIVDIGTARTGTRRTDQQTRQRVAGIANGRKITDFLLCEYATSVPKVTSNSGTSSASD
jgi:hypothetical protein